jgi:3-deoxy-7-phosphoheptulonate synthase
VIIVMKADVAADSPDLKRVVALAESYPGISTQLHRIQGATRSVTEVYLLGPTGVVPSAPFEEFESVEKVVRVTQSFRAIGRHDGGLEGVGFQYNGVHISQDTFHVFAGLCAVDTREHVEETFRVLKELGIATTRAGAYKPRSSPYDFQGLGAACLPWVFELAGKYGVRIVAMEVTHESHIGEIELPVLFKRGMGITLEESLNACEYVASSGNRKIVFCLRGMKTNLGDPHRNFVDFAHVPVVKRLTRLPVGVDPSHSVGRRTVGPDGLLDIFHVSAQGVIGGANMVLVDVHPQPERALCDGPQALLLEELPAFVEDVGIARRAYEERRKRRPGGCVPVSRLTRTESLLE